MNRIAAQGRTSRPCHYYLFGVFGAFGLMAAAPTDAPPPFPSASPASQGMSAKALDELADTVRGYVTDEVIVGGELMVIKNRHVVLHEVFGDLDRDEEIAWEKNTICNIRSMAMCLTGAAAQILVDEGTLGIDDAVAKYLPSFNNDASRGITIRHLLTHRSGLPFRLQTRRFSRNESIREIANLAGDRGPDFPPGSEFRYSDASSEVLGAVIQIVAGVSLQDFITTRLIEPLRMTDTFTYTDFDDPRGERIASLYSGAKSNWTRIWSPHDNTLYPCSAGSQNLHSTPIDFAKFLAVWMDNGRLGDTQVLSRDAVERTLTPVSRVDAPTGFVGTESHYGQMAVLHMQVDASEGATAVVIGHSGSDGTWAAAWPELDMMILYFTQSRGQGTGSRLEYTIDELLINPRPTQRVVEVPEKYKPYLGVYVANFAHFVNEPFTVTITSNGRLAVDIPSQLVFELADPDENGVWRFTFTDDIAVSFERGAGGTIDLMKIHQSQIAFELPREGTELAAKMAAAGKVTKEEAAKYVGRYYHPERETDIEVLYIDGRLHIKVSDGRFGLLDPDDQGRRPLRANPTILVSFQTDAHGRVISLTRTRDGTDLVMPRVVGDNDDDDDDGN